MQSNDWTGGVGRTWAAQWRRTDRGFAGLDASLVRSIVAMAPAAAGRSVDIGCGAGSTSLAIAALRPADSLVGIDLSADLVAVAEARRDAAGLSAGRCRFVVGDAAVLAAREAPVDLFFSRHGVMFFADPIAAFRAIAAAAAPGAGLVFSCFTAVGENPWATEPGMVASPAPSSNDRVAPGPFAFADRDRVTAILAAAGWRIDRAPERVEFRYVVGGGADPVGDAVDFFEWIGPAASAMREAAPDERSALRDHIGEACARRCVDGEVAFPAAAWLWSARLKESVR